MKKAYICWYNHYVFIMKKITCFFTFLLCNLFSQLVSNPAFNLVTIDYDLHGANSAYLTLTNSASAVSNNYILDIAQLQETVDLSDYAPGIYVVSLVCDGELVASENLAIN